MKHEPLFQCGCHGREVEGMVSFYVVVIVTGSMCIPNNAQPVF